MVIALPYPTCSHDHCLTLSDLFIFAVNEGGTSSAIKCRDVRLLDNPEVYSKLTTVTIERPSNPKDSEDIVSITDPLDMNGTDSQNPSNTDNSQSTTCPNDELVNNTEIGNTPTEQNPNPLQSQDTNPLKQSAPTDVTVDPKESSDQPGSDEQAPDCSARNETPSLPREDFEGNTHGATDSPSCEDYQSAASSLDEHSGSITPVSASSHLSNPASHAADPLPTEDPGEITIPADPTCSPAKSAELDTERYRSDKNKKKKKKRRRESERNEEEKIPNSGETTEKVPSEADQANSGEKVTG